MFAVHLRAQVIDARIYVRIHVVALVHIATSTWRLKSSKRVFISLNRAFISLKRVFISSIRVHIAEAGIHRDIHFVKPLVKITNSIVQIC